MTALDMKITLSLVDKASAVAKSIGKSLDAIKKSAKDLGSSFKDLNSSASKFGSQIRNITLVAAAAGGALFALAKSQGEYAERIDIISQKTGISTDSLQKWNYVAGLNGLQLEDMVVGLRGLSRALAEATTNKKSDLGKWLKRNGIAIKDSSGKMRNLDDIMKDLSDTFKNSPDGARKMATAMALFGRAGLNLIPILNLGKDEIKKLMEQADKYGLVIGKDVLDKQKEFDDHVDDLRFSFIGLKMAIGSQLIPVFQPLVLAMTDWIVANRKLIAINVKNFAIELGAGLKIVLTMLVKIGEVLSPVVAAFGGLRTIISVIAGVYIGKLIVSFGALVISLSNVAKAVVVFYAALAAANPIVFILSALALISYGIYKLITDFAEIKAAWMALWPAMASYIEPFLNVVTFGIYGLVKNIINSWETIRSYISKIKEAITGIPDKTITVQTQSTSISAPNAANANTGASPAQLKTSAIAAPNFTTLSANQSSQTRLDVNMKIDAEGRAKEIKAKSDKPLNFSANTGVMV
jgi:hypothetical protein